MVFDRSFRGEVAVNASAARVWEILTDFASYKSWNPYFTEVDLHGKFEAGTKFTALLEPVGKPSRKIEPTLLLVDAPTEFRFQGSVLAGPIFYGEHFFKIEPQADGKSVKVIKGDHFRGLMAPLFMGDAACKAHAEGRDKMLAALKQRAEAA